MRPRWLVLGAGGMLGQDLVAALRTDHTVAVTGATRADVDIRDAMAVDAAVAASDLVINAAAWTAVDDAEADPDQALAVNGDAVGSLAAACARRDTTLLHVSTDYVFAGDATRPYPEDAPTGPLNAYGHSKLAGERHVLRSLPQHGYVVRTSWLYGAHGRNFVRTMLDLAALRPTVDVVDDQRGQPTWSGALARRLVELGHRALAGAAPAGVYHGTASGETTWYGLARAVYELTGLDPDRVRPTTSEAFPRPARRPGYSVLDHGRWALAGLPPMDDWRAMLVDALAAMTGPRSMRA